MPQFSRQIISLGQSALLKRAAQEQGGLLSGKDPTEFNPSDPLRLWIVQLGIIIMTAQLLGLLLRKIHQPKVIAEVLGGILLGPTAFGRIPGFTQHIFPQESISYLSLTANLGLVLFLFLVGLEIDASVIKRNARYSLSIALGGMVLPFGLGSALAVPLYNKFIDPSIKFTYFMLFTGVAYSITAFPVLCRILTELELVETKVGIVVLSAGVGNDIVGWTLLALSVALVNASSGLSALWILMTAVAWALFLLFPVKRALRWLARRTGAIENGPSMFFMTLTILMTFGSAFFTDIIGVHAIFGGFLAGLAVPREGGLAIAMTEKLEDMVSIIFLPLYFTLSGLSTNLGLLDNGVTWAYTVAICALAYIGKFGGCTAAARIVGFSWRESTTIGTLMSCKGLVELIVLNVGLSAGILSQRVFSMFVLEALLLTCMTTPVVTYIYPPRYRTRAFPVSSSAKRGPASESGPLAPREYNKIPLKSRITVVLDKIEHLPGMMTITQLFSHPPPPYWEVNNKGVPGKSQSRTDTARGLATSATLVHSAYESVSIDALRLMELSDRTSAVMKSSASDALMLTDPLLGVFRTFGELNGLSISSSMSIVTYSDLASKVTDHAQDNHSQLVVVPWLPPHIPISSHSGTETPHAAPSHNPFDNFFKSSFSSGSDASTVHSQFIRAVFSQCTTDVALFVDRPRSPMEALGRCSNQHLYLPYFGGPDDRLALDFVVQLCNNARITATVSRITKSELTSPLEKPSPAHIEDSDMASAAANIRDNGFTITSIPGHLDTVYGNHTTQTRMLSEAADVITWARYATPAKSDVPLSPQVRSALDRIAFTEESSPHPLRLVSSQVSSLMEKYSKLDRRLLVVLGRSRRLAVESHTMELKELLEQNRSSAVGSEVKRTIGDVATALVVAGCNAGMVVMQASDL